MSTFELCLAFSASLAWLYDLSLASALFLRFSSSSSDAKEFEAYSCTMRQPKSLASHELLAII